MGAHAPQRAVGCPLPANAQEHPISTTAPEPSEVVPPRIYAHVVVVAMFGGFFVMGWLWLYTWFMNHVWYSDYVTSHHWMFPVICIPFSFLVGVIVKYLKAPTNLDGSFLESLTGDASDIKWRLFPATVAESLASLWSGAALGPEGGIGALSSQIAGFYNEKMKIPEQHRSRLVFGSVSSAYNGLLENPVFTGVLGYEVQQQAKGRATLAANLLGGAIGYIIFGLLGGTGLANFLDLPAVTSFKFLDVLYVIVLALAGVVLAVILALLLRVATQVFARLNDRIIIRALAAGVVFSVVGYFAPIVMFSGENQIHTVVNDPAHYGLALLLVMALGKFALLATGFRTGFLGGPTFPSIFSVVCVAEAIHIAIPGLSLTILIAGLLPGLLMMLFKTPFMVILLTAFMLSASENLVALIVFAVAAVLFVQPYLERFMAARQAATPAPAAPPSPAS